MEKRTKEFLQVGFYLSKFGETSKDDKYPSPPSRLGVEKWNGAYRIFYETLNGGRTILAFERSMKNARDAFDSHFPSAGRIGWRAENREPNPLSKDAQLVFDELNEKDEVDVWNEIKQYADLESIKDENVFDDLIGIQESEAEKTTTKTEGGRKIIISKKYERSPSARNQAIKIHGLRCKVCDFNFKEFYGEWGKGFIEVHHVQALADNKGEEVETNPETDLIVLCANCHRMVHRKKGITLTIEELKEKIKNKGA